MSKVTYLIRNWTMAMAMVLGALIYAVLALLGLNTERGAVIWNNMGDLMMAMMFLMLFFTFLKVSPRALLPHRWHLWLLLIQAALSVLLVLALLSSPVQGWAGGGLMLQGALVCVIVPTATAAAVVTGKLGGSEAQVTTQTLLSNILAALLIPPMFSLVSSRGQGDFLPQFVSLLTHVTPLLLLPLVLAWAIKFLWPRLHRALLDRCHNAAFDIWCVNLVLVMMDSFHILITAPQSVATKVGLAVSGLVVCIVLFAVGKRVGALYGVKTNAGQALGQKNTLFGIWVSSLYLDPLSALAPCSYIVWQNIFNSWQVARYNARLRSNDK